MVKVVLVRVGHVVQTDASPTRRLGVVVEDVWPMACLSCRLREYNEVVIAVPTVICSGGADVQIDDWQAFCANNMPNVRTHLSASKLDIPCVSLCWCCSDCMHKADWFEDRVGAFMGHQKKTLIALAVLFIALIIAAYIASQMAADDRKETRSATTRSR